MKLYSKLFFVLTLISIGIIGCGDDPVTNNNNNPPPNYSQDSLVWHIDSMTVYSLDTIATNFQSNYYQDSCQGFRVKFTGSTNADTSTIGVYAGSGSTNFFQWTATGNSINGNFDMLVDTRNHYDGYFLTLAAVVQSRFNVPPSKYIRLTNIDIYRITYN